VKIRIKNPIPSAAINPVLKEIATSGLKVEIFDKNNACVKAYYLGAETTDMTGNNALMINPKNGEPFKTPIAVELPGFNGYIKPRFFADLNSWRELIVLESQISQLKKIEVRHYPAVDSSFVIENKGNGVFSLTKLNGQAIMGFDTATLKRYLIYYRKAGVLEFLKDRERPVEKLDSIGRSKPYSHVLITFSDNKTNQYEFFKLPMDKDRIVGGVLDSTNYLDRENMIVRLNQPKEYAIAQYTNIGKWLQTWVYFMPNQPVKKF
jgi:hypothetical protein